MTKGYLGQQPFLPNTFGHISPNPYFVRLPRTPPCAFLARPTVVPMTESTILLHRFSNSPLTVSSCKRPSCRQGFSGARVAHPQPLSPMCLPNMDQAGEAAKNRVGSQDPLPNDGPTRMGRNVRECCRLRKHSYLFASLSVSFDQHHRSGSRS